MFDEIDLIDPIHELRNEGNIHFEVVKTSTTKLENCNVYYISNFSNHYRIFEILAHLYSLPNLVYSDKLILKNSKFWKFCFSFNDEYIIKIKNNIFILSNNMFDPIYFYKCKNSNEVFYFIINHFTKSFICKVESFYGNLNNLENDVFNHKKTPIIIKQAYSIKKDIINYVYSLKKVKHGFDYFVGKDIFDSISDTNENLQDTIDICYDLINRTDSISQMSLSNLSNKTNEIMKFLTIATFIATPISIHLSFYGSNFKNLPFINDIYSVFYFTLLIIIQTAFIIILLVKKGWIENKNYNLHFNFDASMRWLKQKVIKN